MLRSFIPCSSPSRNEPELWRLPDELQPRSSTARVPWQQSEPGGNVEFCLELKSPGTLLSGLCWRGIYVLRRQEFVQVIPLASSKSVF